MLPNPSLISCNFSSSPSLLPKNPNSRISFKPPPNPLNPNPTISFFKAINPRTFSELCNHSVSHSPPPFRRLGILQICQNSSISFKPPPKSLNPNPTISFLKTINPRTCSKLCNHIVSPSPPPFRRWGALQICHSSLNSHNSKDPLLKDVSSVDNKLDNGNGGDGRDWTTSILLFCLWAALMYYVFILTPNQTPSRDMYFLEKLLNLKGNDGFRMNEVLVSLWYIMGLWPLLYSMLLLPSGRSSKGKIPVWPFLVLSFFGGAYALVPYFVLWKPPSPPVEEAELGRWPLNFLESKLTSGILIAAGLGIITYAGLANGDVWTEFYQYFRESKFIHVTCLDFALLSTFAPFWVYNDMTARKWSDKGSWILPLTLIPFLGPALYLVLRPPLSSVPMPLSSTTTEGD